MKILVINAGSSSIKYQLFDMLTEQVLSSGIVERIGLEEGAIKHKYYAGGGENKVVEKFAIPDHATG